MNVSKVIPRISTLKSMPSIWRVLAKIVLLFLYTCRFYKSWIEGKHDRVSALTPGRNRTPGNRSPFTPNTYKPFFFLPLGLVSRPHVPLSFFYKGVVLHLSSTRSKNRFAQRRKGGFVAPAPSPLKRYIHFTLCFGNCSKLFSVHIHVSLSDGCFSYLLY